VVYTVGAGETPGTAWDPARMRADVRAIRRDLHANTVDVTGDGVERLTATAAEAAERDLHVWLQPTLGDAPQRDILEHLAECGRFAERLRGQGASVELSVGCEFWLFVPGIVPGETVLERIENLQNGTADPEQVQRRLNAFTGQAGGMGWSVVDYDKDPPEIKGNLVRSEHTQAAYLTDLLSVFESMGLYAAMAFEFLTADAPHRPGDPLHDLDMASYAITKPVKDRPDDPASPWHWEPKEAFHALSHRYARTC
ncbi:abortive phage infection protein, partial [Streptomyces sp. SID5914]